MQKSLKSKVAKGAVWVVLEQLCVQGLNFGMGVVLARLLTPNDYGTVALVTIFISIAQVLVASGLGQALVQKKQIDELDVNSVFYVSTAISLLMYAVLFFCAPLVARYYQIGELTIILRVLAINLLFYAINSVQNAELYRQLRFDLTFRVSIVVTITSAVIGIGMAIYGFGVWALVASSVLGNVAGVLARAYFISWRPRLMFSIERVKPLFHYGSRLMANSLLGTIFGNLYGVIIGKFYTRADLAFVNKGQNIPALLLGQINASIIEVALPALVQMQDDRQRLVLAMKRLFLVGNFVVMPIMTALLLATPAAIRFLYGEQWVGSIPYMQLMCLMVMWGPMGAVNQQGLLAVGRSGVYLKLGIARNIISLIILFACLTRGVLFWMVVNTLLFGPISALLDAYCGSRYLGYRVRNQLKDALPTAMCCLGAACCASTSFLINWGDGALSLFWQIGTVMLSACLSFFVFAVLFRLEALNELLHLEKAHGIISRFRWGRWLLDYFTVDTTNWN